MKKHTGPYTAHVRFSPTQTRPARVASCTRKTFGAAENFLSAYEVNIEARWITNAEGRVHSVYSKGSPGEAA